MDALTITFSVILGVAFGALGALSVYLVYTGRSKLANAIDVGKLFQNTGVCYVRTANIECAKQDDRFSCFTALTVYNYPSQ